MKQATNGIDVQYLETSHELHNELPFLPERMDFKKPKSLSLIYIIKLNILFT